MYLYNKCISFGSVFAYIGSVSLLKAHLSRKCISTGSVTLLEMGCFPTNDTQSPLLRSGHLDIKDAQYAEK